MLLAIDGDSTLVGIAYLRCHSRQAEGLVANIGYCVVPSSRGSGIGSRLVESVVALGSQHGVGIIRDSVFAENKGSLRILEKMGFKAVGLGKENIWHDQKFLRLIMELRLKESVADVDVRTGT